MARRASRFGPALLRRSRLDGKSVLLAPFRPAAIVDGRIRLADDGKRERQHRGRHARSARRHHGLRNIDADILEERDDLLRRLIRAV